MPQSKAKPTPIDIPTWLLHLPKAELHLHLEGTITPETLVELSRRHDATNPSPSIRPAKALYVYSDFQQFLDDLQSRLRAPPHPRRLRVHHRSSMLARSRRPGCCPRRGLHLLGHPAQASSHTSPFLDVMDAIERMPASTPKRLASASRILWIIDAVRHFGVDEAATVFRLAAQTFVTSSPASSASASAAMKPAAPPPPLKPSTPKPKPTASTSPPTPENPPAPSRAPPAFGPHSTSAQNASATA